MGLYSVSQENGEAEERHHATSFVSADPLFALGVHPLSWELVSSLVAGLGRRPIRGNGCQDRFNTLTVFSTSGTRRDSCELVTMAPALFQAHRPIP
jgi:hypothetical protein